MTFSFALTTQPIHLPSLRDVLRQDARDAGMVAIRWLRRPNLGTALIIPPCTDPGSMGDHAMLSVAIVRLRQMGFTKVDLAAPVLWPTTVTADGLFHFYRDGGVRHHLFTMRQLAAYQQVVMIGADVLDGIYGQDALDRIALLGLAATLGCNTGIMGASFSETPNPAAVALLRKLPRSVSINARDPVSHSRMLAALGRPVNLTADLAFMFGSATAKSLDDATRDWINIQRREGRRIVGINLNALHEQADKRIVPATATVCQTLLEQGLSLLFIPHDYRASGYDQATLARVYGQLNAPHGQCHMLNASNEDATKAALTAIDLLYSGRMHAVILAMAGGIPAISLTYNGKFEGLYDLAGLADENLLVSPDALIADPIAIAERITMALADAERLGALLALSRPNILQRAQANFAGIAV